MSESSTSHGSARPLEVDHGSRLLTAGHGPRLAAPKGLRLDSQSHRCALITRVALHSGPQSGVEEPRALSPKRTGKDTQYGDLQYIITHQNHIPKHGRMRA